MGSWSQVKNNPIIALGLIAAAVGIVAAFYTQPAFFDWAFERHQNTLSWLMRPLLLLPFCFFAYQRSINGILLSVLAILTSMFWFPAPAEPDPQVLEFLEMEKAYLTGGWTPDAVMNAVLVAAFMVGLAAAFWMRSIWLGTLVALAGAAGKVIWSLMESPEAGGSIIPYAVGGAAVFVIAAVIWRMRARV